MPTRYPRSRWTGTEQILVHGSLDQLRGGPKQHSPDYRLAKSGDDIVTAAAAAERIIKGCIDLHKMKAVVDSLRGQREIRTLNIVVPYRKPDEAAFRGNAIGITFAKVIQRFLQRQLPHLVVNFAGHIVQVEAVGRTSLAREQRFLHQARFTGAIAPGEHYMIVDDVVTTGASLAQLRSHILRGKGTFVGTMALAYAGGSDETFAFAVTKRQVTDLKKLYGNDLVAFWKREFGHELECLTHIEAKRLLGIGREIQASEPEGSLLDALRDRVCSS